MTDNVRPILPFIGALLAVFATNVHAEPIDPSKQPDLKSWSNIITDVDKRFVILRDFDNGAGADRRAVLDRETGLVWEQRPQNTNHTWSDGRAQCIGKDVGGRKGWRLPSVAELGSLVDPSTADLALPVGHPFVNVRAGTYWSATTVADEPANAWTLVTSTGNLGAMEKTFAFGFVWCVRGPMNPDQY